MGLQLGGLGAKVLAALKNRWKGEFPAGLWLGFRLSLPWPGFNPWSGN